MIDATKLDILVLVLLTMMLIQGHRSARKQKTSAPIISQDFQLILIGYTVEIFLGGRGGGEPHTHLMSSNLYSRGESYLYDFIKKKPLTLACIQTFTDQFLSNLV